MTNSPSDRILVVASSLECARDTVKRIRAIVHDTDELPSGSSVPWTIKNRYYTADVHFRLVPFAQWVPQLAQDVPAVIYAWKRGEPYAAHILTLSGHLSRFEPEVSLAIALGSQPAHESDPPEGADGFLADHGFEYIDAERAPRSPTSSPLRDSQSPASDAEYDEDDDAGIQGLPRVLDALSTIMWPTMERTADSSKRKSHMPMLFDVLPGESAGTAPDEADAVAALLAADAADHGVPQTRAQRMQSEMAALERWLIENEDLHETELHGDEAEEAGLTLALPTPMAVGLDPWAVEDPTPPAQGPAHGFEDDFAAFVSAPSLSITPVQALSTEPSASMHVTDGLQVESPQFLVPSHTGGSVRSLHSTASSLMHDVDPNAGYEALDDHGTFSDDDEELLATAVPRSLDLGLGGGHNAPFDLTDMLGTLQALKDDIAGIEDEERRRAMSARFASDFVFNRMDGVE